MNIRVAPNSVQPDQARLLIVADDLTGACDAAAQFAQRGVSTVVELKRPAAFHQLWKKYSVVAVSTESRHKAPAVAARRVQLLVRRALASGATHFYKKTDSTLRGNIGAELRAFRSALGSSVLFFVPAAPQFGRTTQNGFQLLDGKKIDRTEFGRDILAPVRNSHIPTLLKQQNAGKIVATTFAQLKSIDQLPANSIVAIDAETGADLREIGVALAARQALRATAGAAAFAGILADVIPFRRSGQAGVSCQGPMLVASGSLHPASRAQVKRVAGDGRFFRPPLPRELLFARSLSSTQVRDFAAEIIERANGRSIVLATIPDCDESCGRQSPVLGSARVSRNFALLVTAVLASKSFGLVLVFGGETFAAIVKRTLWRRLQVEGELCPGVALARIEGENSFHLAAKPGGFGQPDLLRKIQKRLSRR